MVLRRDLGGALGDSVLIAESDARPSVEDVEYKVIWKGLTVLWLSQKLDGYLYSRYENPTVVSVEEKLAVLEGAEMSLLFSSGMAATTHALLTLLQARRLNLLQLGDEEAHYLGVNVQRAKLQLLLLSALLIGAAVAMSGVIGFVGLVVPHLVRMRLGGDHRWLLPCSALGGACLLLVSDTLARTLVDEARTAGVYREAWDGRDQRGARRLSGVAVAPVGRRQPPADLHAGGARQIVARPRQPDKTDKRRAAFHFHRPQPPAVLLQEGADAFGLRAAFLGRHRRREIAHDLRIGVERGEGRQVVVAPGAQP